MREQFLKAPLNPDALLAAARALAARGEEATLIVSRELRQISRITGRELSLALAGAPLRAGLPACPSTGMDRGVCGRQGAQRRPPVQLAQHALLP